MTEAEKVIKSSACTWLGVVGGCLHLAGSGGRVPAPGWEWWTGACTWMGVVDGCLHLDGSGGRDLACFRTVMAPTSRSGSPRMLSLF